MYSASMSEGKNENEQLIFYIYNIYIYIYIYILYDKETLQMTHFHDFCKSKRNVKPFTFKNLTTQYTNTTCSHVHIHYILLIIF